MEAGRSSNGGTAQPPKVGLISHRSFGIEVLNCPADGGQIRHVGRLLAAAGARRQGFSSRQDAPHPAEGRGRARRERDKSARCARRVVVSVASLGSKASGIAATAGWSRRTRVVLAGQVSPSQTTARRSTSMPVPFLILRRPPPLKGHHIGYRRGERFQTPEPGKPLTPTFYFDCACGTRSESTNAGRVTCRNCGSGSGRVRRKRDGSSHGRQRFKFTSSNGQPLQAVSFASKEGETVRYTAVDGVIETSDAEHAAVMVGMQLEPANDSAQKIVGPADQPSAD